MLVDAEQLVQNDLRDTVFDVCICGAGPAGITLARTLAGKNRRVALMEGGGLELSEESQSLYLPGNPGHTLRLWRPSVVPWPSPGGHNGVTVQERAVL